jgi:arylamine N-acetyltransferase
MVLIVTINSLPYHVDVGFANFGTLSPVHLEENTTVNCVPGLQARFVRRSIAENVTEQKLWILETCDSHSREWQPGYCFSEMEFLPRDFRTFNFRTMRDPTSWFTTTLVLTKVILSEEQSSDGGENEKDAIGTLTLFGDTLKRRVGGRRPEELVVCKSEDERVEVLQKWFDIVLSAEERVGIKGLASEIVEQAA